MYTESSNLNVWWTPLQVRTFFVINTFTFISLTICQIEIIMW